MNHATAKNISQDKFDELKGHYGYVSHRIEAALSLLMRDDRRKMKDGDVITFTKEELADAVALLTDLQYRMQAMFQPRERPDLRKEKK
mgnify:CR=1 FL=1